MPPAAPPRALLCALAAAAALLALAVPARADTPETGNFDARAGDAADPAAPPGDRARDRLRDRLGRYGALSLDEHTGTLRAVGRLNGFLTGASGRDGADVALDYMREHATAFGLDGDDLDGLRLAGRTTSNGVEHLTWEQRYGGIPVADAGLEAAVTRSGRLVTLTGPPAADLAVRSVEPALEARAAYAAARRGVGAEAAPVLVESAQPGGARATRFADGGTASLALYRGENGYRLAWRVLAPVSSIGVYDLLIDARSGATVRRANRVDFASADVFDYTPRDDGQVTRVLDAWLSSPSSSLSGPNAHAFSDVHDVVPFRPGSGQYDLTPENLASEVQPVGGNYQFPLTTFPHYGPPDYPNDRCFGSTPSGPPPPPTPACTWDPRSASSWEANRKQSVTQLFYLVNRFHDHLQAAPISFTDGGFRRTGQPLGDPNLAADPARSDPVIAQALDGADSGAGTETPEVAPGFPDREHRNNANFLTLPDGQPGLMQMYLWMPQGLTANGTPFSTLFGGYDGSNDASIVYHEYAHGLSNRLVTDAAGFGALNTAQAGALGEGLSDYYAMDHLVAQGLHVDDPDEPDVRLGRYLDDSSSGPLRYQPLDCEPLVAHARCPDRGTTDPGTSRPGGLTYADFAKVTNPDAPEVHADGEIWGQTLWSIRQALIDDPAISDADGVLRAREYITEGLRLAPDEPSFLDLRNAILAASFAQGDDDILWKVFAERGMGYFAATDSSEDVAPIPDFTDPADLTGNGAMSGTVRDEDGNPVAGAAVGISGLDTGVGPTHTAQSGPDGTYAIDQIPTDDTRSFPVVRARKAGFVEGRAEDVLVPAGGTVTVPFTLAHDWSSPANAARVNSFTGPDNTSSGCGPGGLIDDDPATVWGSARRAEGQRIIVELGAPVDVDQVDIDPSAGCGDDATAALGGFEVSAASTRGGPFTSLAQGTFGTGHLGRLNSVFGGEQPAVRFLQLHALTPQGTAAGTSGEQFVDVAELRVRKVPGSPIGAAADTGAAQGVGSAGATLAGTVAPYGGAAQVLFEYGTTTGYGAAVSAGSTPAGGPTAIPLSAAVTGLEPSTGYHFRIVAVRGGRRYEGADATFVTAAAPPVPTPTPTPTPTPSGPAATLSGAKIKASRKGMLKVRVAFSAAAPAGSARIAVLRGKQRLAVATFAVRPGRTVTKTVKLNKRGRRVIRPGRAARKVTLELRLPGGQKFKRTVMLARTR